MSANFRLSRIAIGAGMLSAILLSCLAAPLAAQTAAQTADKSDAASADGPAPPKLALLVGCTQYENANIPALRGPRNDVPLIGRLLRERFNFADQNIRKLYDGPGAFGRPTYANIAAGFAHLLEQATPGTQIVITLSGHGTQTPLPKGQTNPLDPRNPEPDGLDEVFLPADATNWEHDSIGNAIRDNQMGDWLDALKQKGANVFIVFDCCHSGTMTRGVSLASGGEAAPVEATRAVDPVDLGIPAALLVPPKLPATQRVEDSTLELKTIPTAGSIVAFYAAQSFETAPDLPRPANAERVPENYYGMLSYTLSQALRQQKTRTTYRDLSRAVVSLYRSERGSRGPTPLFAGDLDREVLGLREWPAPSPIHLERTAGELRLSGGEVLGVTNGSVFAVLRPGADPQATDAVLGYVCASDTTATSAAARPCSFGTENAVAAATFPDFAHCKLVSQSVGDLQIKLQIAPVANHLAALQKTVSDALNDLPAEARALVDWQTTAARPDFELRLVDAQTAKAKFQLKATGPQLLLLEGERLRMNYAVADAHTLSLDLERDLQKIYKWRNLWRVIEKLGPQLAAADSDLKLEVLAGGKPNKAFMADGQDFEVRLANQGFRDYWVTLLFLSADYSIDIWYADAIPRGQSFSPLRSTIDATSYGPEGFAVLAISQRTQKIQPNFAVLEQTALGMANRDVPSIVAAAPQTPFGQLLSTATAAAGKRAVALDEPTNPTIVSWSWVTLKPDEPSP